MARAADHARGVSGAALASIAGRWTSGVRDYAWSIPFLSGALVLLAAWTAGTVALGGQTRRIAFLFVSLIWGFVGGLMWLQGTGALLDNFGISNGRQSLMFAVFFLPFYFHTEF